MLHFIMRVVFKILIITVFPILFAGCSARKGPRPQPVRVPMAINIRADNSINFTDLNVNFYRLNVKDILDDFLDIDPVLVDAEENPVIVVDITIEDFNVGQKDERVYRRVFSRNVQAGTDAKGQPVYQTVTASADLRQTLIPARVRLTGKLTIKDAPPKNFQRSYYENYTWQNVTVENIQGDQRAIDPSIYFGTSLGAFEPNANDILMTLSNRDMLKNLSNELQKYYNHRSR